MTDREVYTDEFGVKCKKICGDDPTVTPKKLRLNLCEDEQQYQKNYD